ncbi:hypothetical protein [Ferrimonas sp.]|uniref:hypothetical protein n=1 Tax=Ferrimonas sp. TaxID=2080861 RepID=UPI003A90DB44
MLTKILVTLLVITVVLMGTKRRAPERKRDAELPSMASSWLRFLAPAIAGVVMLVAAAFSGWQWYQGQQILQIRIIDAEHQSETLYEVYRKDLDGRHFTTRDGLYVELGSTERMEISPIE